MITNDDANRKIQEKCKASQRVLKVNFNQEYRNMSQSIRTL